MAIGLLLLRLVLGVLLAGHGAQKLFGSFGGHGLKGTSGFLATMGLRPAGMWAFLAGISEFGGGVLLALGLLTPLGAIAIIAAMLVAILTVHSQKLWVTEGGMEYNLVLIASAAALALTGPGRFSLDAALAVRVPLSLTLALLVAALIVIGIALSTRAAPAAQAASSD